MMAVDTMTTSRTDAAATEQLSTAPTGTGAAGRRPLLRAWRQLTSMRTALLLLFLLAAAAVPGSLLPQRPVNPLLLVYLNRLSDLLFILARAANAGGEEPLWKPGANRPGGSA